jgi:hypothetical protein
MARFWVGGTGNWDASDTTHWSATSGGASGASVPTATDDVTFDASSGAGTATVAAAAVCANLTMTAYTGAMTLNASITVAGNLALPTAAITIAGASGIIMNQPGGVTKTVTSNGSTINGGFAINGSATGIVQLADTHHVNGQVTLNQGTFDTNSKSCTWFSFVFTSGSASTITLGASAITITGGNPAWGVTTATNLTVTANTATVTLTGANGNLSTGGANWNGASFVMTGGGVMGITSGTVKNLTVTGTAAKTDVLNLFSSGTFTVTGQLLFTGNSLTNRLLVFSSVVGTARSLIANGTHGAHANVDFEDIALTGTAGTLTGASLGDCQGNSGITFTVAAPQTWVGTSGGNWSDVTKWTSRVPLPQDNVLVASAFIAAQTVTADMPRMGKSVDFTGTTGAPTLALGSTPNTIFGSLTLAAGMGRSGSQNMTFSARSAATISMNGVTFAAVWSIAAPGGTYSLSGDLLGGGGGGSGTLQIQAGTFDAAGFNIKFNNVSISGTATVRIGAGTWTFPGTATIPWSASTTCTVVPGTGIIDLTDTTAGKTFQGGNQTYPTLRYRSTGSATLAILGNNVFANLDLECTTARTITLPGGGTQYVVGALTLQGAAGQTLALVSSQAGNQTVLWAMQGGTITNQFASMTADVVYVTGQSIAMQNVITDAQRTAALSWGISQQGGSTDGLPLGSGIGVYTGGTNLFRNGQNDATTNWFISTTGITVSTDATVPAPFSPQSIKLVCDGTQANQGVLAKSATGQAAAATTVGVGSVYVKGVAGQQYDVFVQWFNTDLSVTTGTFTTFTATGVMQLIAPASLAVAAGKTGDQLVMKATVHGTRAETFWVAHAMLQTGVPYVSPYVATSGGATATRFPARIQVPASLVTSTKGFMSVRIRSGQPVAAFAPNTTNPPRISSRGTFQDYQAFIQTTYNGKIGATRNSGRSGAASITSTPTAFTNAGDVYTTTYAWDATGVYLSINGAASEFAAGTGIPPSPPLAIDLGNQLGNNQIDSTLMWAAFGNGVPTAADNAILGAAPSHDPFLGGLSAAAALTAVEPFDTATYEVPPVNNVFPVIA